LNLSGNSPITDEAVLVLAEVIQQAKNALSHLRTLRMDYLAKVTGVGVGALLTAVIHNCPQIESFDTSLPSYYGERTGKDSSTLGCKGMVKL
jgi:hypothetical protein